MQRSARIQSIEETKAQLTATEEQLFFFDNLDSYEMELVDKEKAFLRTLPRTNWNIVSFNSKWSEPCKAKSYRGLNNKKYVGGEKIKK